MWHGNIRNPAHDSTAGEGASTDSVLDRCVLLGAALKLSRLWKMLGSMIAPWVFTRSKLERNTSYPNSSPNVSAARAGLKSSYKHQGSLRESTPPLPPLLPLQGSGGASSIDSYPNNRAYPVKEQPGKGRTYPTVDNDTTI